MPTPKSASFEDRFVRLSEAGYTVIAVRTLEERWLVERLERLAEATGRSLLVHTPSGSRGSSGVDALVAFLEAFPGQPEGTIALCLDAIPLLVTPEAVRAVRNVRDVGGRRSLVLSGVSVELPASLSREVPAVRFPLPDGAAIEALVARITAHLGVALEPSVADKVVTILKGLTRFEAERILTAVIGAGPDDVDALLGGLVAEKTELFRAKTLLELITPAEDLASIGGLGLLKGWLEERRDAFGERAQRFGLPAPKGLFLAGVQGCGKSLTAKAIARHLTVPLMRLDFGRLFGRDRSPEEGLDEVIGTAETSAPTVLWIDEIDKLFSARYGGGGDGGALRRVLGTFITWLQEKTAPVFVVTTANTVDDIPPELMRKGRFDEIFFVDLPNQRERKEILTIHVARRGREPDRYDLDTLAKKTEYFTGAELEQAVIAALYRAFAKDEELSDVHLQAEAAATVPLFFTREDEIKALRDWAKGRARPSSTDTDLLQLFKR